MTNYSHGKQAEEAACRYLKQQGYKVRDTNWRTRYCEIDIVAEKDSTIYFVEVKYRQNTSQGMGLDYITPKKVQQMSFAAEVWVSSNNWLEAYSLGAIEVSGPQFEITQFLTDL